MEKDDAAEIRRLSEELTQASHKLAEAMYQQASQSGQAAAGGGGTEGQAHASANTEDDVVDADFEEVKDDKK
jgi:molecular chaperone DnaK